MALTEAQKRAKAKYKSKVRVFRIECYPTETEIIAKLEEEMQKDGVTTYIKNLIRTDMEKCRGANQKKQSTISQVK